MATEDFTTWTESDPFNRLTVASSSITIDDLQKGDSSTWVYDDFGAGYWSGDWTIRFKFTTPASGQSDVGAWIYPLGFYNAVNEPGDIEGGGGDFQCVIYSVGAGPTPYIYLEAVEDGSRNNSVPDPVSFETTYYITMERDDDGGVNGTGQLTLRIYTVNYYGESGAVEHDTVTLDCGVGEQNDFRYIMLAAPRGSGLEATDGLIEDLDLDPTGAVDVEIIASGSMVFSGTASLSIADAVGLSAAGSLVFTGTAAITKQTIVPGTDDNSTNMLIGFGNDELWYEDI